MSKALEWYRRGKALAPAELNVFVSGSYRSALRLAVAASSSRAEPPRVSTCPLGRIVAFISIRACDIGGPYCHCRAAGRTSLISVGGVPGAAPPELSTPGFLAVGRVQGRG